MVRKSVRQHEALRRARERQRATDAAENLSPEKVQRGWKRCLPSSDRDRPQASGGLVVWVVRRPDRVQGSRAHSQVVLRCLSAASMGAVPRGYLRSLRGPGGGAARRDPGREAGAASGTSAARGLGRRAQ